jgi:hypothetical protein
VRASRASGNSTGARARGRGGGPTHMCARACQNPKRKRFSMFLRRPRSRSLSSKTRAAIWRGTRRRRRQAGRLNLRGNELIRHDLVVAHQVVQRECGGGGGGGVNEVTYGGGCCGDSHGGYGHSVAAILTTPNFSAKISFLLIRNKSFLQVELDAIAVENRIYALYLFEQHLKKKRNPKRCERSLHEAH